MKYKKYMKKMKKKILVGASGGLIAGVLLAGSGTVYADTTDYTPSIENTSSISGMHLMRQWNTGAKVQSLAASLGLDKSQVQEDLKAGKTLKQILQEHGIVPAELHKAFSKGKRR